MHVGIPAPARSCAAAVRLSARHPAGPACRDARRAEQPLGRTLLDDAAVLHHGDVVADDDRPPRGRG